MKRLIMINTSVGVHINRGEKKIGLSVTELYIRDVVFRLCDDERSMYVYVYIYIYIYIIVNMIIAF